VSRLTGSGAGARLSLPEVTIVSINGKDPEKSVAAIRHSSREIEFGRQLLITNRPMEAEITEGIEVQIEEGLKTLLDYNRFCLLDLHDRIETEFCLIVQPDGFVVNPWLWSDFFLNYDYIGAPWNYPRSMDALQLSGQQPNSLPSPIVGNGGFSLRSKRLLKLVASLNPEPTLITEDCVISVKIRRNLEREGMRFAPVRIAQQFSLEWHIDQFSVIGNHFGFHGRFNYFEPYLKITGMDRDSRGLT
jgi:hypothetical protein